MKKNLNNTYGKKSLMWSKGEILISDLCGRPDLIDLINREKKSFERILDAGCGTGKITRAIKNEDNVVIAFDRNERMLDFAKKEEKRHPLGIKYQQEDIFDYPYEEKLFDKVICSLVLDEYPNDFFEKAIQNFGHTLRPGGKLYLFLSVNPNIEPEKVKSEWISFNEFNPLEKSAIITIRTFSGKEFSGKGYLRDEKETKTILGKANFRDIEIYECYPSENVKRDFENMWGNLEEVAVYSIIRGMKR